MHLSLGKANQFLGILVTTSTTGDFLTQFSVMVLLQNITNNSLIAGLVVPVSYAGSAIGSAVFPYALNQLTIKACLISTQLLCAASTSSIAFYWINNNSPDPYLILGLFFATSFCTQIFGNTRDVYSKGVIDSIKSADSHMRQSHLQAQAVIENAFMTGQFSGPILFFILVWYFKFSLWVPFVLDIVTFLITAVWIPFLPDIQVDKAVPLSIRRPLQYLQKNEELRHIFLIRAIGLWIPLAAFNYVLFSILTEEHNLPIIHASWAYPLLAIGSILGTKLIEHLSFKPEKKLDFRKYNDFLYGIGFIGCLFYGLGISFFQYGDWGNIFVLGLFLIGFGNGFQKISTRTIIRRVVNLTQFSEITGLELAIGKTVGFLVCIGLKLLNDFGFSYQTLVLISISSLLIPALLMKSGIATIFDSLYMLPKNKALVKR